MNTAISFSTFDRTFTGDWNLNICKIKNIINKNFFVLFDNKNKFSEEKISEHYDNAQICSYTPEEFLLNDFTKTVDKMHRWGSHQNPNYFFAHFRMLMFYIKQPFFDYYWFFDDDVSVEGDLNSFVQSYELVNSDFVAIQVFKKENYPEFPHVSCVSNKMKGSHGNWLSYAPGPGDKYKSLTKHMGSFFPIVRFSNQALKYLFKVHRDGYYGYSEGFVPTTIASEGLTVSSILDEDNKYFVNQSSKIDFFHKRNKFTWEWL